jgi:hypothetical protein
VIGYAAALESWHWIGATNAEIWMTTGAARLWPQIVQGRRTLAVNVC